MRKISRRSFLAGAALCGAAAALTACGGSSASSTAASSVAASSAAAGSAAAAGDSYTVGICQLWSTQPWMPLPRALRML